MSKKRELQAYQSVVSDFKDDFSVQCQECPSSIVWELVDAFPVKGFKDWLRRQPIEDADYEIAKMTIGVNAALYGTIAEMMDALEDKAEEEAVIC